MSNKYHSTSICVGFSLLSFLPKEKGRNAEMTEPGCLTPEEWHVGSPGWSATEPRDRIAGLIQRRAVQERKEIPQSSPHEDYPKEEPLLRKSVISRGAPKEKGHSAEMTESHKLAVNLDSWFLTLGSVTGSVTKNLYILSDNNNDQ